MDFCSGGPSIFGSLLGGGCSPSAFNAPGGLPDDPSRHQADAIPGAVAVGAFATDLMRTLASERTLGIPNALFVWATVSVLVVVILQRTPLGRYIYAIGNKEAAAYLAGVDTRRVTVICFVLCCLAAALAGVLLAVLLNSVLSIMEMPEAGRQVIYGLVIILMLLVYGRGERVTS